MILFECVAIEISLFTSYCDKTPWSKTILEGEGLLGTHFWNHSGSWKEELSEETEGDMEECSLACSLWFAKLHDHLPRVVIIHNDLGPPYINRELRNCHHRLVYRPNWWDHFLGCGYLFPDDSNACQADKKKWTSTTSMRAQHSCLDLVGYCF